MDLKDGGNDAPFEGMQGGWNAQHIFNTWHTHSHKESGREYMRDSLAPSLCTKLLLMVKKGYCIIYSKACHYEHGTLPTVNTTLNYIIIMKGRF